MRRHACHVPRGRRCSIISVLHNEEKRGSVAVSGWRRRRTTMTRQNPFTLGVNYWPRKKAMYSWNFSNGPDLFSMPTRYGDGAAWNETLASVVRKYSRRPISAGMHLPTITAYNGFRPDLLAPNNDFLSMHAYSIYFPQTELDD